MTRRQIKTIDINTKTWFDKVNGNTYFAQQIIVNYGMSNAVTIKNAFQYGSGDRFNALRRVSEALNLKTKLTEWGATDGIIIRENVWRGCKYRDVINFGK